MKFWSRVVTAAAVALGLTMLAASAATPATPTAPRNLKAAAQDEQVTLTWSSPSAGGPITYYQVITSPADYPRTSTFATNLTVTGLKNGTTYSFAVRAYNGSAFGPAARATAVPKATPPGPPTNLGATQTAPGQIRLDWTPPTSNGSAPAGSPTPDISHYTITISPGGTSHQVPASTLTYTASGLADNITYTFKVTATNTRPLTGPAATVYAPLPTGATIGLQPTAGGPAASITVTGELFLKNETIVLYWDTSTHIAASVVSDDTGAFTKVIKPFKGDKPKVHKLCANVQPKPCANFTLQGPPTPTPKLSPSPGETPTPSPAETPQASGVRPGGGGISGLDIITRPPFVFLPIIGIIGLVGLLAYWLLSRRRRPMAPTSSATVVHRATRPDYMAPFPPSGAAPMTPPAAAQPSAWDAPFQAPPPVVPPAAPYVPTPYTPPQAPAPPPQPPPPVAPPAAPYAQPPAAPQPPPPAAQPRTVEWPAPPNPPAAPDEPPDLPQPSE